jgi:hypothetical protein
VNVYSTEAYISAIVGFASLAAAASGGSALARGLEIGAGVVVLALAPFIWLESRRATAAMVAISVALVLDSAMTIGRGIPAAVLLALSSAGAAFGAYLLAFKRRREAGTHPLDLPVYG